MNLRLLFTAIPMALVVGAASWAAKSPLDAVFACQKISDDAARLTCLDREVAALRGESQSGDVIAVDRKRLEEDSYGLDRSSVPLPAPKSEAVAIGEPAGPSAGRRIVRAKDGRIEAMESLAVAQLDKTPYGQLIVTLQNGQVWKQTDRTQLFIPRRTPHKELTVSITNAALGSYKMQLNGDGPWFRVDRAN